MPRDVQFLELITDLKAELTLSSNVAVGVDYLPVIRRALKRSYQELHRAWRWPHLHRIFDPVVLVAGQRFYELPDGLDYDRVTEVIRNNGGVYVRLDRGVSPLDFTSFPPTTRTDPVLKWDVQSVDGVPQIEMWPVPASDGVSVVFSGYTRAKNLVNDEDLVDLDSDLVLMFAAASLMSPKEGEKQAKLKEAQAFLAQLKADSANPSTSVRFGMGTPPSRQWRPTISVATTSSSR